MSAAAFDPKPPRPGRRLIKRFALGAFMIVALSAGATATAGLLEVKDIADIVSKGHKIEGIDNVLDDVDGGGPQTILVLGSDRRFIDIQQKNPVRSDTLMLIRLDPSKEATAVMSLPRDLKVNIPDHGTNKINAAYAYGGAKLTVETVKSLFHFPINHVVNVNFGGFQRAINRLKCVYVDIDRKYFNDNNPPNGSPTNYAVIDIDAGYQKLCGADALSYVRYRHFDDDFVRAARQQSFLRQAKAQFGLGNLFKSRKSLLNIFSAYTQTDIRDPNAILKLMKLAFESSKHPIRTIHFDAGISPDLEYAEISEANLAKARDEFLSARASKGAPPTRKKVTQSKKRTAPGLAPGLIKDRIPAENYVADASTRTGFPVYYPGVRLARGSYVKEPPRVYDIYDRNKRKYRAYRMVVFTGYTGQYYGVQGMTWKAPPILDDPSEVGRKLGGRKFDVYYDGQRIRQIALRTSRAVYWVSNTLSLTLTNKQMLDIARSLRLVGS